MAIPSKIVSGSSDPAINQPRRRVIAVMPAYNAADTLERTVADIPEHCVDDILLVDDASQDNTVEVAHQ